MKLSWLFHPFPLLWHDSIITRYILDRRSRLISPSGRTSDQNQLLLLDAGRSRSSLFVSISPLPSKFFPLRKEAGNRFLFTRLFIEEKKTKKEKWLNFILVFIYRCAFQFCNNFQYRIFPRSMDEFGWIFTWIFSLSKRNPLSFNYNIYISDKS